MSEDQSANDVHIGMRPVSAMKRHNMAMLAMCAMGIGIDNPFVIERRPRQEPESKPCLKCGSLHFHTNAYCSPECCKAHRAETPKPSRQVKQDKRKKKQFNV